MPDAYGGKHSLSTERNFKCPTRSKFAAPDVGAISETGRVDSKAAIRGNAPIAKLSSSSKRGRWMQMCKRPYWPPATCGVC
jgi:hypothetical protein